MLGVWYGLLFVLAAIGLTELLGLAERWLLRSPNRGIGVFILPLSGHVEQAEYAVRSMVCRCRWEARNSDARCVVLDRGMDGETRKICELLCQEYSCLSLCGEDGMQRVVSEKR